MPALSVAVLASGRGSNLRALIDAQHAGQLPINIVVVGSDRSTAPALRYAESENIPAISLDPTQYSKRAEYDSALFAAVANYKPRLIVLAGFMRVLDASVVRQWQGHMINIHPSLLPKYRGLHTHQRALEAKEAMHGASVHFVTPELDGGPIIAQAYIHIQSDDTPESLAARLLPIEHQLLCAVVNLIAQHRIQLTASHIEYDSKHLIAPLVLSADGSLHT